MKKRKVVAVLLAACLCLTMFLAVGCGEGSPGAEQGETGPAAGEGTTVTFTDSAGREVELPAEITRIVSTGPLAQIALFALAPDMLVGLATRWDPAAEQYIDTAYYNLPVLGQFYGKGELNLEEIAKVDPQVIIDVGEPKSSVVEDMDAIYEQVGIPTVHIEASIKTMGEAYRTLGKLLNREEKAELLANYCEEVYSNTLEMMKEIGDDERVDLIYCTGEDGLNVIAKDSFFSEIFDLVGNNIAVVDDVTSKGTGNPVDMEQLVLWDPDVIIFSPDSAYQSVAGDKAWQELTAVKNDRYYETPEGPYCWIGFPPSVNRYMGMIWIAQLLYPDQAGYDVYQEAVKYYELFYGCELTADQYQDLVANSLLK
ncbi:MAG: ABC transporter substrate-binding protein [Dethiobacteria bacterium]|jgi:iron complex transport system substrate-binding protein